jgi:hypothetical protein
MHRADIERVWPHGMQRNQLKTSPNVNDFTYIERF